MGYDSAVNIPTLIGSVLSTIATFTVLVSYLIFSQQKRSFRHALVFNLARAEFVNSLNNSISGLFIVSHHRDLEKGLACDANGYIGHLTVQAADFSILAIALVTLFTVIRKTYLPETSVVSKVLICASVWVVPLVTSSTAVSLDAVQPIGGNWCWIAKERVALRYALGDGWRVAIILSTSFIYLHIYTYVRRHFKGIKELQEVMSDSVQPQDSSPRPMPFSHPNEPLELELDLAKPSRVEYRPETCSAIPEVDESFTIPNKDRYLTAPSTPDLFADGSSDRTYPTGAAATVAAPPPADVYSPTSIHAYMATQTSQRNAAVEREVRRMLLLNAYPIMYIVLWIPGITSRLTEAALGYRVRWLAVAAASTQYVGLANAVTYGWNEHMRSVVRREWRSVWAKVRSTFGRDGKS
ncbi:G protein-coupled glucose receptor regulating Gpa2-domain-containing protein [Phyllosticta citriasiana]|uniref:G protein-coupled glucose receptor regulating Gpa2-domain-containing protein n=1 Tax=Phyllosticta citriasiana TaxID=595635 RepID=A0ABR1KI88_9PEZI